MAKKPIITVGIPVYNEEKYIESTVETIIKQDFNDFEIIIADNNSTDNTQKLCLELEKKYVNISYYKHDKNIGAYLNQNSLIQRANGQYYVLAGAHDLWSKNYLSGLYKTLKSNKKAVLAYGKTIWIDDSRNDLKINTGYYDTSGLPTIHRFNMVFWGNQHALYGMYKLSALKQTKLQRPVFASGAILLNELSLIGDIICNTDLIWYRRVNRNIETTEQRLSRYYKILFYKKKMRILPYWSYLIYYLAIPFLKIKITLVKRILLFLNILFNFVFKNYYNLFVSDFVSLIKRILRIKT